MTDIVSKQMENIELASELLDAASSRTVTGRPQSELASECAELRRALAQMLDILGAVYVGRPPPGTAQARMLDELLAEVPASCRDPDSPDDDEAAGVAAVLATRGGHEAQVVAGWLRAARSEGPAGGEPPGG